MRHASLIGLGHTVPSDSKTTKRSKERVTITRTIGYDALTAAGSFLLTHIGDFNLTLFGNFRPMLTAYWFVRVLPWGMAPIPLRFIPPPGLALMLQSDNQVSDLRATCALSPHYAPVPIFLSVFVRH